MSISSFFKDKIIVVLGGTGSIGSEIVSHLLKYEPKTIRILSNSENELWETRLKLKEHINKLRFLLGDIRNYERVKRAIYGADYVFNAAAVKHVPISEYNPMEAIAVNINGLENIIEASLECNVKKLIHISTDKAVNPTTVMGATKMIGERLCITRGIARGSHTTIISCVRFGNVLGTRGSIIPLIKEQIKNGDVVTLTDENMRRFFLSISEAVNLVLKACLLAQAGEIFVLKMPTIVIKDLFEVIIEELAPKININPSNLKIKVIGPRLHEKLNEELISPIEFSSCYETEDMFIIYPKIGYGYDRIEHNLVDNGKKLIDKKNFSYSTNNATPLNKEELRAFLKNHNLI